MEPFFKTFDNGMRLVFKKVEKDRPATLFVCVKAGSVNETDKNNGISHFIEHLNFKGTNKRSAKQISTELEEIGANANAFTSKFTTCFFATTLADQMENCFDILSDIIFNSKYAEEDIEKERKVVYEEIDMYADDPEGVSYEEFTKNFYAGTNLQKTVLGTKKSLKGITRQDIVDYVKSNYIAPKIVVSVVGHFDEDYIEKLTCKYFADRFKEKCEAFPIDKTQQVSPNKKFSFIKKDVAQTHITFGFPCPNTYSPNRMAYVLAGFIFGGGMGSRLFQKVREERGLVYSISSMPEMSACGGDFVIGLGTNQKNSVKAMKIIKTEMDTLKAKGFKEEELKRAKIFSKSLIVSSSELGADIAKSNALSVSTYGKVVSVKDKLEKIDKVTLKDINKVAQTVFDYSSVCGCVVSNQEDKTLFEIFD